jgi:hypothetical protein
MIKHIFYIKIDKNHRKVMNFLKKPREPNENGMIAAHDRFATQNIKINSLFENKSDNFKQLEEEIPKKQQIQIKLLKSEVAQQYRIDFCEVTKWLWLRFTWLSDEENRIFNSGVRKCKD